MYFVFWSGKGKTGGFVWLEILLYSEKAAGWKRDVCVDGECGCQLTWLWWPVRFWDDQPKFYLAGHGDRPENLRYFEPCNAQIIRILLRNTWSLRYSAARPLPWTFYTHFSIGEKGNHIPFTFWYSPRTAFISPISKSTLIEFGTTPPVKKFKWFIRRPYVATVLSWSNAYTPTAFLPLLNPWNVYNWRNCGGTV